MMPAATLAALDPSASPEAVADLPPLPPMEVDAANGLDHPPTADPSHSVRAFLSDWEMNDFLFLIAMENLRPVANLSSDQVAWFSIVPESWRVACVEPVRERFRTTSLRAAFLVVRCLLSVVFLCLALGFAWRSFRSPEAGHLFQMAFLTLAWFWLLLPTQNPWYCTWFLPFVAFSRNRAWLVLSGLALAYYLRFWLVFHFPSPGVLGTRYAGGQFFDYIVTWLEFGPWVLWLGWDGYRLLSGRGSRHFRSGQ
jgi:hypothetical protein